MAEYPLNSGYLDDSLKLKRLIRTLRKRWLVVLATSVTVFAGTAYYTFTRTPLYQSSASLLIDNATVPVAADLANTNNPAVSGMMVRDANLSTEIAILKSRPLIESAIAKLKVKTGKPIDNSFVQTVVDNLTIRPEKDAMVLRLTYRDSNPQRARDILESLSDTYAEYSLKDRRTKSSNAIKFIEAKLPEVRKQLEKSALAMTQFRKTYNIVDPESYAASVYRMRENLEQQAQDLQIKIAQTQRQYEEIQRQVGKPTDVALSSAMLAQDATYQSLVKQYQEAVTNYSLERTRFSENTPSVQGLKDRRDQLYRLMQAQAQTLLGNKASGTGLSTELPAQGGSSIQQNLATQLFDAQTAIAVQQAQVNSIRSAQAQISTVFAQIPQLQQKYTELQRQLVLDTSIFTKLTERLEELRISEAQEISSWRELEPPFLPTSPISPDINRNLLLGGLVGIALGIALAYLLERSDQRIREVEEVKELIDIPLLGAIPRTDIASLRPAPGQTKILPSYSHSAFREALSSFALNLRYLGSDQSIKTIAFTSAVPSEGKSTLIFNLSMILAEFGNSVLLIDADMRKPMIHRLANTHNRYGLSTAIATNRPWRQLVQAGDTKGLLHILTSGPIPPNPIVLLESNKMSALLEVWRESYDYVLIDTPPVVGVSDAQSLASRVDTVVLVAAIERSTRPAIARALEILASSRGNVAGILINLINKTDSSYHYGYYSSYYYQYPSQLPEVEVVSEDDDDRDLEVIEDEDDLERVKTEA